MLETDAPWCGIRPSHASSPFVRTASQPEKDKKKFLTGCLVKGVPLQLVYLSATFMAGKFCNIYLILLLCLIITQSAMSLDSAMIYASTIIWRFLSGTGDSGSQESADSQAYMSI